MPLLSNSPYADQRVDVTCLARRGNLGILEILLTHIAFYSFISTKKKEAIEATKKLSKEHQIIINKIIQPDLPSTTKQERPKPTPEQVILTNSTLTDRLAELRSKIEELTNSNNKLKSENENLRSQIWRVWRSIRLKNNLQTQIQTTIKMMKLAMLNKIQHYKFLI